MGQGSSDDSSAWREQLDATTLSHALDAEPPDTAPTPTLTLLSHPDPRRIGDLAPLPGLAAGHRLELSRLAPRFGSPRGGESRPLADAHLSRQPLVLEHRSREGTFSVARAGSTMSVTIDGEPLGEVHPLTRIDLERGVVVCLAQRVTLLLHQRASSDPVGDRLGMVGESDAIQTLRRDIERLAAGPHPVLLRGASGTGKELVASALHEHGPNPDGPLVRVNVAAIPASLAPAELFGAARGAFTGARDRHRGYFRQADGGILFLDEIGEASLEVQGALLRTLETGEVQAVGDGLPQTVSVRVVAATDANLEDAVAAGRFRGPLYHRLASHEIQLPRLDQRREDFGRLLLHFLRLELAERGAIERLDPPPRGGAPWLPATLVAELALQPWPGNVRQLRNLARALTSTFHDVERIQPSDAFRSRWLETPPSPPSTPSHTTEPEVAPDPRPRRRPSEIDEATLAAALRRHAWRLKPTATDLGISRTSLYLLLDRFPSIRRAGELSRDELVVGLAEHGDPPTLAKALEVSLPGLLQRLRTFDLD